MTACISPVCNRPARHRDGTCDAHFRRRHKSGDARLDLPAGTPGQSTLELEDSLSNDWCECDDPSWEICAPIFPGVRQCATCKRPDRTQGDRRE